MKGYRQASDHHRSAFKPTLLLGLVCLVCFGLITPVNAQGNARALLSSPDTTTFPTISVYMDAHDSEGQFVHNLQPSELTILENDHPASLLGLREIQPGVRVMVAINAGPALGIRDQQGNVRYEAILKTLQAWAQQPGHTAQDGASDYSLITNEGILATTVTDLAEWLKALNGYQPDMRAVLPSLASLSQAMSLAGEPTPHFGMERALLYITPPPEGESLSGLANLADQARQIGVHIFIWMVAAPSALDSAGANALNTLAAQTNGGFFVFSGAESLPNIQTYLEPLQYQYALSYTSAINKAGSHSLVIKITRGGLQLSTPLQIFPLNIQPPNPMFLSPPVQITRTSPPDVPNPLEDLRPGEQALDILVEFPDGFERPLKFARLYVDNQIMMENTQAPFEHLTWDLSRYTSSGRHLLRVEVEDSQGLTRSSSDTPIQILVELPKRAPLQDPAHPTTLPAIIAIVLAGSALTVVLAIGWRRRARAAAANENRPRRPNDALTQLVRARTPFPLFSRRAAQVRRAPAVSRTVSTTTPVGAGRSTQPVGRPLPHLSWPHPTTPTQTSPAQLVRLSEANQPLPGSPIPIQAREITFGRDPTLATCVLDSLSVEGLHARLLHNEDGSFVIRDEGSVAGTWVNYAPISREGVRLEHGDLLHFGKVAFRFELSRPVHIRKPQVKVYKETP